MFYLTGLDITNDKQMFNFIKNHFTYYTMNSWNRTQSIANNVKLYNLGLSGDWAIAEALLSADCYDTINYMISEWTRRYPGYRVYFSGRSGGYLVLCHKNNVGSIIPDAIEDCVDYEEYKRYCKKYYGGVKYNREELRETVQLIQSFDRLCDELRAYCDELSNTDYEMYEMEAAVERFNDVYANDLEMLDFSELYCEADGIVDLSEVIRLQCLTEAFLKLADRTEHGYRTVFVDTCKVKLEKIY